MSDDERPVAYTAVDRGMPVFRRSGQRLGTDEQVLEYTADEANALPDASVKGRRPFRTINKEGRYR